MINCCFFEILVQKIINVYRGKILKNKLLFFLLLILILSCETTKFENTNIDPLITETENINTEPTTPVEVEDPLTAKVDEILNSMTLEEKIGQLFILDIRGYTALNNKLTDFLTTFKPSGVILFSNNIKNNEQVVKLISDLQNTSNIPMFIAVDEEGGIVSRLGKEKNVNVTHLPPALTVGNKKNPILAYNTGKILGRELRALGFNMDMAPVADVNTNPNNPVIGNRTYSADPYIAGLMVLNVVKGFKEENIISVIKHFPGHGDTNTDSHLGTVVSPHNRERLDQIEFIPFKMGIDAGVDVIMTAHMTMSGISNTPLPATLNPEIITNILREDLGFNGIVMTDALDMGAITKNFSSADTAILAIKAGVDILLIPQNPQRAFDSLLNNIKNGDITENRINESVRRIIELKIKRNLLDNTDYSEDIYTVSSDPIHKALIQTIINK